MITELDAVCPYCGRVNELHEDVAGNATPQPGDVSVCWACASASIFTADLKLRPATLSEQNAILAEVQRIQAQE